MFTAVKLSGLELGLYSRICGENGGGRCRSVKKSKSGTFPLRLEIPQGRRDSHLSHRSGGDGLFWLLFMDFGCT
jgi:hypothetical protein